MTARRHQLQRMLDMRDAIARIQAYAPLGRERFESDELVQVWMVHQLEVIGEAAAGIAPAVRGRFPNVEWQVLADMRNRLAHGYFDVDTARVWETVERDVPVLSRQIDDIVGAWGDDPTMPRERPETQ
jgi:uncharacterized protein with HEPN domain